MDTPGLAKRGDAVLVGGFLIAVAMWTAGYVCRLPLVAAPAPLLGGLLLLAILAGGFLTGRASGRASAALLAGLLASVVNLLILGALIAKPDGGTAFLPAAALWLPGSLVAGALLAGLGGLLGARRPAPVPWLSSAAPGAFAGLTAAATLLLVVAGGLVTGAEAGMAVPDWPSSFGSNMFLCPLARMTGGIYYEHAHRLFGTLVGLCALVLAIFLAVRDRRKSVKLFALAILAAVIVQGVLGGLRVTENDRWLAAVHATVGQAILGGFVALAAVASPLWLSDRPRREAAGARADRGFATVLLVLVVLQIFLGALVRQLGLSLHAHITGAVVVFVLGLVAGLRLWGLYPAEPALRRTGVWLVALLVLQVALGIAALVAAGATADLAKRPPVDVLVTTAHQATGALILAAAALATVWTRRSLAGSLSG
jgi:cytochrome c oxidase assembly protein subunit 15